MALRAIWSAWNDGTKLNFRGDFYTHTLMTPFFSPPPAPGGPPRVFLAAVGEAMTAVAGEVADGLLAHAFCTGRYLREVTLPALGRGLACSGRRRGDVEVSLLAMIATGRTEQEMARAVAGTRAQIAFYGSTPAYRGVLELHGWAGLGDELNSLSKSSRDDKWEAMGRLVDDEVLNAFAVVAEPAAVAAEIRRRFGGLIDRVSFYSPYETGPRDLGPHPRRPQVPGRPVMHAGMMGDPAAELVVTADGPIRLIELNRPQQLNAASQALHTALAGVWDRLAADEAVRAVVLTGRGRAFSAGGDFHVMTRVQRDEAFREQNIAEARSIITGMVRCPVPVIAAVNGPAVGLGCSLALLSDMVLMADGAYLADPHVQVGLVAGDGGALVLPLLVGLARAKELLFLGERVSAEEAVRLGLANRVVPADKLLGEAMDLARAGRAARRGAAGHQAGGEPAPGTGDDRGHGDRAGRGAGQHALPRARRDRREAHREGRLNRPAGWAEPYPSVPTPIRVGLPVRDSTPRIEARGQDGPWSWPGQRVLRVWENCIKIT